MKKIKLSVVLATKNEEENIARCLDSVKRIADEIIIFDEFSTDKTVEIAEKFGAKVYKFSHKNNFHETKQKAIEKARGVWILQLDADEALSGELENEIRHVVSMNNEQLVKLAVHNFYLSKYFRRHQELIEMRDGKLGKKTGEIVAFFLPRLNMFMGKPLTRGGVYPDGVIRLIKNGKARLPAKHVHEQMEIDGEVGWLVGNLEHYDSPSFRRYLTRNNRYTDLLAKDYQKAGLRKNITGVVYYLIYLPLVTFADLFIRHKAILDGYRGFVWSLFSALRFPVSFIKYWRME